MLESLKQWVPSEVCLSCDGCCRFKEADSTWRPKLSTEDKVKALAERIFSLDNIDSKDALVTVPCHGLHICTFFNPTDHTCKIYRARPFECELYPFILSRHSGHAAVYMHWNCPYAQEHPKDEAYGDYLKKYFCRPDVLSFVKNNPHLIADYKEFQSELEYLFSLDLS